MNHFHTPSFGDECIDLTCVDETLQQSYLQEQTRRMRTFDESQFSPDDVDACNGLLNMQTTLLRTNSLSSMTPTITTPPTTLAARKQLTTGGDPNEPTKPLSAYSLFFRDTVSIIKQQNPNSNYYELSRIVANMWEVLDEERKFVYNNRTEAARLEYIKLMNSYQQQMQQQNLNLEQNEHEQMFNDPNMLINGSISITSPLQTKPAVFTIQRAADVDQDNSVIDAGNEATTNFINNSFANNQCIMPAVQIAQTAFNDNFAKESNVNVSAVAAHYQMPQNQIQQQTNFNLNAAVATTAAIAEPALTTQLTNVPPIQPIELLLNEAAETQTCLREGCTKRAIVNPNWDDEYCSNECVVAHCRNVFTTWVESNRNEKQQYDQQHQQQLLEQQQKVG